MRDLRSELRNFIIDNFMFTQDPAQGPADGESLLDAGIIDSTGVLEVVMFIEQQTGMKVADEELVPDNFDSIDRIVRFVERRQAASSAPAALEAAAI